MGKWIDVKEKLPKDGEQVIVWCHFADGAEADVSRFVNGVFWLYGNANESVSHWQELPEAPVQSQTPTDQTLKNLAAGRGR